eukprot:5817235-Pyramimonas_sp.AAC.1
MDYQETLIGHYQDGGLNCRYVDAPAETIEKVNSVDVTSGVKGKAKLYETYCKEFGDPSTNGKNHAIVQRYQWKDGTIRKVVLVPETLDDEMEAAWTNRASVGHKVQLHNGELTDSPNQVAD